MNSLAGPFNSLAQASNTLTKSAMNSPVISTMSTAVNSTLGAVNSIGQTTLSAANSVGETALGAVAAVNSIGTATLGGINSAVNSMNSSFTNSSIFKNVNSRNAFSNVANNSSSASSGSPSNLGMLIGVLVFLVTIFLLIFIVFKDQINVSWEYFVRSLQKFFGMNPPQNQTSEQEAAITADDVNSPMPTNLDVAQKAKQDQTNILNKLLPMGTKEVFNVSSNDYTYYDAEPLCLALGAELATYDQVEEAWAKGADWCNYGWTKGQVAIYPTQKETWEKLQGGQPDQHTACGQPGVNGGFFDNPEMRFGVNCYGVKPSQSSNDERILMENGTIPKTVSTLKIDQQIQEIKNNLDTLGVLPFSSQKWSTA